MGDAIDALIEQIIVDAHEDQEQLWAFRQAFEDSGRFPFRGHIVGVEVEVTEVDFDGNERRGLLAVCRRGSDHHTVSLLDVEPVGPMALGTRQLIDAYRRWSHAAPTPVLDADVESTAWVYPRLSSRQADLPAPLALRPMGEWDPDEEYWAESGEPIHPLRREVIAAGVRPCFEMEQVLPGVHPDDWDSDPIVEAAEMYRAGYHREAIGSLEHLLALDRRCVDAWSHLGLIAFQRQGPARALEYYDTGVAIAEASLPVGFGGVLSWGMVDNRPFLRCLHGLGLCAWRQRRWDDAEAVFTSLVWVDPYGSQSALACLDAVEARRRWTRR